MAMVSPVAGSNTGSVGPSSVGSLTHVPRMKLLTRTALTGIKIRPSLAVVEDGVDAHGPKTAAGNRGDVEHRTPKAGRTGDRERVPPRAVPVLGHGVGGRADAANRPAIFRPDRRNGLEPIHVRCVMTGHYAPSGAVPMLDQSRDLVFIEEGVAHGRDIPGGPHGD